MNTEKTSILPKQYLAVASVLAAMTMGVLNGTIMNVALPTLAKEF
jgi:DHA2 family multidrug resistance protein-like MFS transporter